MLVVFIRCKVFWNCLDNRSLIGVVFTCGEYKVWFLESERENGRERREEKTSASANVSTKVIHHVDEVTTSTCNMENFEHNLEHGLDVDSNTLEATTGILRAELL
ncbi:hypothetical protein Tco_0035848 [Tanacetum coccineum]